MAITLTAHEPMAPRNGLGMHGVSAIDYELNTALIDLIKYSRMSSSLDGADDSSGLILDATRKPTTMPTGGAIRFFWSFGRMPAGQPCYGEYAIRHNLDTLAPGEYTITASEATIISTTTDRVIVNVATQGNWSILIDGPDGAMPDGWTFEMVKTSNEAAYDNTSLPSDHWTRNFIPEYIALATEYAPDYWRSLRWNLAETSEIVEFVDYPTINNFHYGGVYPLQLIVSHCHMTGSGLYYSMQDYASEDMVMKTAEFFRDNLDVDLYIYLSTGNETWNYGYKSTNMYRGIMTEKLGTLGTGTFSVTAGSALVTATGAPDLTTIFGTGLEEAFAIGGYQYAVSPDGITATTMNIRYTTARETLSNMPYYIVDGQAGAGNANIGHAYLATRNAKIWTDTLTAANQRHRLVNVMSTHHASPATTLERLTPDALKVLPDYLDPLDYMDAVATACYFGALPSLAMRTELERLYDLDDQAGCNVLWRESLLNENPTYPIGEDMKEIRHLMSQHRAICDENSLKLMLYEGGCHSIQKWNTGGDPGLSDDVNQSFFEFMSSPEASEVFEVWAGIGIAFLDTGMMHFHFMSEWNEYGNWSAFRYYGWTDERTAVLKDLQAMDPWWDDRFPPRWGRVQTQEWEVDTPISLNLNHYASVNTASITGTPPDGCTLVDGIITGTPTALAGPYTFTASNGAGAVDVDIPVAA